MVQDIYVSPLQHSRLRARPQNIEFILFEKTFLYFCTAYNIMSIGLCTSNVITGSYTQACFARTSGNSLSCFVSYVKIQVNSQTVPSVPL